MLLVAAFLELVGDLSPKWWAETNSWLGFGAGLVVYGLALAIFAVLLRRAELAVIFALVRQVGVLYERVQPAGALMAGKGLKTGEESPVFDLR